jgi:hypothetical protein
MEIAQDKHIILGAHLKRTYFTAQFSIICLKRLQVRRRLSRSKRSPTKSTIKLNTSAGIEPNETLQEFPAIDAAVERRENSLGRAPVPVCHNRMRARVCESRAITFLSASCTANRNRDEDLRGPGEKRADRQLDSISVALSSAFG